MNIKELKAWIKDLIRYFHGNQRSNKYIEMISELLHCLEEFGVRMSIKIHFLGLHLNYFPDNCGYYSEEQGGQCYQDIAIMENRYQGSMTINMLADYCWSLKRNVTDSIYNKKTNLQKNNHLYLNKILINAF